MRESPPLLVDTTSLLRAHLDWFDNAQVDSHALTVIESLILFEHILLDGPSVERNSDDLQWLSDIDDGIEILNVSASEESALYSSAEVLARQMHPSSLNQAFLGVGHLPRELGQEIQPGGLALSTDWKDLKRQIKSEDLRRLQKSFERAFGGAVPYSGAAFVALARSLYYLCLQESVHSSLLLDPLKRLEADPLDKAKNARHILEFFDHEVGEAFRERKQKWLGDTPRKLRLPLLINFVNNESRRRGWSIGRVIFWMRQSHEVELFRNGLDELQDALESNDAASLDAIFAGLDTAAVAWSKQLGVGYKHSDVTVSVSLPFIGIATNLPLPHLIKRSTSSKLLVFVGQLLAVAERLSG